MLLTDGENTNEPDPLEIAQIAADAGVRIYPVGVGSLEGSVVEVEGFQILSRLDEGRITSYNVCYTKLLRKDRMPLFPRLKLTPVMIE